MSLFPTNANQVQAFAGALYGVQVGTVTMAQVNNDIQASGLSNVLNSYFLASFGGVPTATVASTVASNLGLTGDALASGTAYITAQLNATAPAARGALISSILNLFSSLSSDATFGQAATAWNNKVTEVSNYTGTANIAIGTVVAPVFTLTAGIDNLVGGAGADTFISQIGQISTLQASDNIIGGDGVDTLRVVTDGTSAAGVGGFRVAGVERLEVQSQAVGGTQLGLENAGSLSGLAVSASTTDVSFGNIAAIAGLTVSDSVQSANISLSYAAAAVAGKADVQNIALTAANLNNLTVNGIETVALTTNSASTIATLASAAPTVTLAGAGALTATNALNAAVTRVDASAATGAQAVTLGAAAANVTILGGSAADKINVSDNTGALSLNAGAGDDIITAASNLTKADSINGGEGSDTLVIAGGTSITEADVNSILTSVVSIEKIQAAAGDLSVQLGAKAQTAGINTVAATTGGNVTVTTTAAVAGVAQYTNALTVNLSTGADTVTNAANTALTVAASAASITAADALTGGTGVDTLSLLADGNVTGADLSGVSNFESVVIRANTTDAALGAKVTLAAGTVAASKSITVDASALGTKAVATIDGSANASTETLVATGGAGNDTLIGGAGNDELNGGDGKDDITIGTGSDKVNAGAGDDIIRAAGNLTSADTIDGGDGNDTLVVDSVTSAALAGVTNVENLQFSGDLTFNTNVAFTTFDMSAVAGANALTLTTGYTNATTVTLGANDRIINTTDAAITANVTAANLAGGAVVQTGKGIDAVNLTADATGTITVTTSNLSGVDSIVVVDGGDNTTGTTKLAGSDVVLDINSLNTNLTVDGSSLDAGTYATDATLVDGKGAANADWENLTVDASGVTTKHNVVVIGGAGHDTLTGGAGDDALNGGSGNDVIVGTAGRNVLEGGAGNDTITGGSGIDVIRGGDGNDSINMVGVLTGEDMVDGGEGTDSITLNAAVANLDFLKVSNVETLVLNSAGTTTLGTYAEAAGIRNVTGHSGNDVLDASSYAAGITVTSGDGVDQLTTGAGNDVFVFSGSLLTAADKITAGAGDDAIRLDFGTKSNVIATNGGAASVTANIGVVQGVERIVINDQASKNLDATVTINFAASYGTDGTDGGKANLIVIDGSSLGVTATTQEKLSVDASLNSGDNVATTTVNEAEAVSVIGGAGDDTLIGGGAADTLLGGAGHDDLTGNAGADSISGGEGRDLILGGDGADTIDGGANADIIVGGAGADNLTGGTGPDVFGIYAQTESTTGGVDVITDFVSGSDRVYIDAAAISGATNDRAVFIGNGASFEAAQAMLTAGAANNGVVFNSATNTLWVDANNDGTLNANDIQIQLSGVSAVTKDDVFSDTGANLSRTNVGTRLLTDAAFSAGFATVDAEDTVTVYANQATTAELLTIAAEIARIDVITVADSTAARDADDTATGGTSNTLALGSELSASQLTAILGKLATGITASVTITATGMNAQQLAAVAAHATKATLAGTVVLTSELTAAQMTALLGMTGANAATINAVTTGMSADQILVVDDATNIDGLTGNPSLANGVDLTAFFADYTGTTAVVNVTSMDPTELTTVATNIAKVGSITGVAAFTNAVSAPNMTAIFGKQGDVADDTAVATSMSAAQLDVLAANTAKLASISGTPIFNTTDNSADEMSAVLGKYTGTTAETTDVAVNADQVAVIVANAAKFANDDVKGTMTLTASQFGSLTATGAVKLADGTSTVTVTGASVELAAIAVGANKDLADTLDVSGNGVLSLTATQAASLTSFTMATGDTVQISGQVGANALNAAVTAAPISVIYTDGAQASTVTFTDVATPTSLVSTDTFTVTNADVITGFDVSTDTLNLQAFGLSGAAQVTDFTTNFTVLRDDSYMIVRGQYNTGTGVFTHNSAAHATTTNDDYLVVWDANTGSGIGAVNMVGVVLDNASGAVAVSNLVLAV